MSILAHVRTIAVVTAQSVSYLGSTVPKHAGISDGVVVELSAPAPSQDHAEVSTGSARERVVRFVDQRGKGILGGRRSCRKWAFSRQGADQATTGGDRLMEQEPNVIVVGASHEEDVGADRVDVFVTVEGRPW